MKIASHKHLWQLVGLGAADLLLFSLTDAARAPSVVIIIGFVLLTLTLYLILYGMISLTGFYGIKLKRKRPLVRYLTMVVSSLLALQSIGELSRRDVLVVMPLVLIGYFYSSAAKTARRNLSS